jgi:hypothetical protein
MRQYATSAEKIKKEKNISKKHCEKSTVTLKVAEICNLSVSLDTPEGDGPLKVTESRAV